MNEKPYEHKSKFGTEFSAKRCDFRGGVDVCKPDWISAGQFASDVAEMTAQHCISIWPELNGFSGYGGIEYRIRERAPDSVY